MAKVILYDIPSKQGGCWSLNPWKTRLVLNYKRIPYTTQWVEYPDLKTTLSTLGLPPNPPSLMTYTSPSITLTDGTHMMESRKIAEKLEQIQPEPSLHLDAPVLTEVDALIPKIRDALAPILMPKVPRNLLNPSSAEYFRETRAVRFKMPLDELEKSERGGENAWKSAVEHMQQAAQLLKAESGPFFLASGVSYADFVMAGFWRFVERIDDNAFERMMGMDEVLRKHYEACKPWLERDD